MSGEESWHAEPIRTPFFNELVSAIVRGEKNVCERSGRLNR